jgi:hypothetical protein
MAPAIKNTFAVYYGATGSRIPSGLIARWTGA